MYSLLLHIEFCDLIHLSGSGIKRFSDPGHDPRSRTSRSLSSRPIQGKRFPRRSGTRYSKVPSVKVYGVPGPYSSLQPESTWETPESDDPDVGPPPRPSVTTLRTTSLPPVSTHRRVEVVSSRSGSVVSVSSVCRSESSVETRTRPSGYRSRRKVEGLVGIPGSSGFSPSTTS